LVTGVCLDPTWFKGGTGLSRSLLDCKGRQPPQYRPVELFSTSTSFFALIIPDATIAISSESPSVNIFSVQPEPPITTSFDGNDSIQAGSVGSTVLQWIKP
jgi:hypothetical protein